ncbi:MAG: glycosyltransferase [Chloroflexi bacterium CFX4]|nr:glycosyltransferase [Chloroflexi bacterium CFX4]MDL1923183.1 glycosyltransferase [Chloroflexi bacterium CFX3]
MSQLLPELSIAICTRNRAALLKRTLTALLAQVQLSAEPEILVVDNGSTDQTASVVATFSQVRYVMEPHLGIANARNRAVAESGGRWLIYLDDDALPCIGWLEAFQTAIAKCEAACLLGRVLLEWEGSRPQWFPQRYETLLSSYDLGETAHELSAGGYLLTTNTAFKRSTMLALSGFKPHLGHKGKSLLGGEDNDIFNRLIAHGERIWYVPKALALHWVPKERQTFRWLAKRLFWDGATQPLLDYGAGQPRRRYLREMGRDVRRAVRLVLAHYRRWHMVEGRRESALAVCQQMGRLWMNLRLLCR